MPICNHFNGGFMKPYSDYVKLVDSNKPSDVFNKYSVRDDNTFFNSRLKPVITNNKNVRFSSDTTNDRLVIFYDATTQSMPAVPHFVDPTADDFHFIEDNAGIFLRVEGSVTPPDVFVPRNNRQLRNPHFVFKEGATGKYLGRDRYDNYMTEVLRDFGGKFTWYEGSRDTHTSYKTFASGDVFSDDENLHLAFMYLESMDATNYSPSLWYSRMSNTDGTFENPSLIEPFCLMNDDKRIIHHVPRFTKIDGLGLILSYISGGRNSSEFYCNLKISRDDGTNWSDYSEFKIPWFVSATTSHVDPYTPINMSVSYAENKLVYYFGFCQNYQSDNPTRNGNIVYSEDMGRTFVSAEVDFATSVQKILSTRIFSIQDSCMYYDQKNSRFIVASMVRLTPSADNYSPTVLMIFANYGQNLKKWDLVITENMGHEDVVYTGGGIYGVYKDVAVSLSDHVALGDPIPSRHNAMIPFVDKNRVTNLIMNGAIKESNFARNQGIDYDITGQFDWIPNPILVPIEIQPSTDQYLNQFQFSNYPMRARKIYQPPEITITPSYKDIVNPYLSIHYDSIINNFNECKPTNDTTARNWQYPRNTFSVMAATEHKNGYFMLGVQNIQSIPANILSDSYINYNIPVLIYRPNWSNVNIKPRQLVYFTPARYYDSTFVGWNAETSVSGQEIRTLFHTKKYFETMFMRTEGSPPSGYRCGLSHVSTDIADQARRGAMWNADATRGVFAHFICSLDSKFYIDATSMVHFIGIGEDIGSASNGSGLQTFLGKDFIGVRSSGSVATDMFMTFPGWDTTRNIEFLTVVNRFRTLDSSHEHRLWARYENNRDWTMLYYNILTSGIAAPVTSPGIKIGNLWRWPTSITGDATNIVFFKYHAEGWSAFEMMRQISDQETYQKPIACNPTQCLPFEQTLPNGLKIAWAGQDATAQSQFEIFKIEQKYSPKKMLDMRPSLGWRSIDTTNPTTVTIDFGREINFNSLALYKHNLYYATFSYAPGSNTNPALSDFTRFLLHSTEEQHFFTSDSTEFGITSDDPTNMYIVNRNTMILYDQNILKYIKFHPDIVGKKIKLGNNDGVNHEWVARVIACQWFENDSSCMLQFENPTHNYFTDIGRYLDQLNLSSSINFAIVEDRHFFKLTQVYRARYLKIDMTLSPSYSRQLYDPTFEGYFKIGLLGLGMYQENENPIENGIEITELSPTITQGKISGSGVPIQVSNDNNRHRFQLQYSASKTGFQEQFGQLQNFYKDTGNGREMFFFIPKKLYPQNYTQMSYGDMSNSYGYEKMTREFYFVRYDSNTQQQTRRGMLGNISVVLEEVP